MKALRGLSKLIGASVGLAVLAMAGSAQASLIGQTITCSDTRFVCSPGSATVIEPGSEFTMAAGGANFTIDVGDMSVLISFASPIPAGFPANSILTLGDLIWSNDPTATLTGITNFSSSNITGIGAGNVTAAGNTVMIDYSATSWGPPASVSFDLLTTPHGSRIPVPPTLALFLVALGGIGLMRRRAG